jgi:hypothetical protein
MNKMLLNASLLSMFLLISGCASTPPQQPVPLSQNFYSAKSAKIGVAMSVLPKVDTQFPGAGCLLCLGVASVANQALTQHVQTLTYEDLPQLKTKVGDALRAKGYDVTIINDVIDVASLPKASKEGANIARQDFSSLKAKYNVEKIAMITFSTIGVNRFYASYIPTSDPKATVTGLAYIVDTSTNTYDLYLPISIQKSGGLKWDEPPKFPGLTNAYFQAIEDATDIVTASLVK